MIGFAHWRSGQASGGNRYDDALLTGLPAAGVDVRVYSMAGSWPLPTPAQRAAFARSLSCESQWLVDNIVGSAAPAAIAGAVADGRRVTLLIHYFPADDPSLSAAERTRLALSEHAAVEAASNVVVTSNWAAQTVRQRYGRADAVVAQPGVEPAPVSPGSGSGDPLLLWLSRLTTGKDPLTFLRALAHVADLPWRAALVGPYDVEPTLTREVQRTVVEEGLSDRIDVMGPLHGAGLDKVWERCDLLVHTSRAETYGMVVAEALARGIASVVAEGTGALEAQLVGASFPQGDHRGLAAVLRAWLSDEATRQRWRQRAISRRPDVPTWADTVAIVADVLRG